MPARIANIASCITQVTFKLVHYARLINQLRFGLTFCKVLANFPTDKYGLDCYCVFSYVPVYAMYFSCKCNVWKILSLVVILKYACMHVCVLPLAGRMRTLCNLRLQCLPYERENDFSLEYISQRILTLN